jgi:hypothetical protein
MFHGRRRRHDAQIDRQRAGRRQAAVGRNEALYDGSADTEIDLLLQRSNAGGLDADRRCDRLDHDALSLAIPLIGAPTPSGVGACFILDSLIHTRLPPTVIGMIERSVWLSNDRDPAPNAEPFAIGGTPHVATHRGPLKSAVAGLHGQF